MAGSTRQSAAERSHETGETLGLRLRSLRTERGLSIAALAQVSGVPRSTISKIENGLLNPSLVHAINLASALRANLGFLVDGSRTRHARYAVVRARQRGRRQFDEMGMQLEDLNNGFVPGLLESRIGRLTPDANSGAQRMSHSGEELVHVLSGAVTYDIDGIQFRLCEGDSLHFKCSLPHRWANDSGREAILLWVFSDGLSF